MRGRHSNGQFVLAGFLVDPGIHDTSTATVDYGDGTGSQPLSLSAANVFLLNHRYSKTGKYQVTVRVVDDDGGIASATVLVRVTRVRL